jgi:hypothetical protein
MLTTYINRTCLLLVMLAAALSPSSTVMAQETGTVVIDGLNSPMGVMVTPDGSVWVADTGVGGDTELELLLFGDAESMTDTDTGGLTSWRFGETARVVRLTSEGVESVVATLPSLIFPADPTFNSGGAGLAMIGDQIYVTTGMWWPVGDVERPTGVSAVVRLEDGHGVEVANTWDVERAQNPDGWELATNPYGLASGPDGHLWVADAAANTLLRIDPETGEVTVVTAFEGMPGPIPNPDREGAMETAPVPTGVAFDADGELYVSLLPGVPFVPGTAKVVKVTRDGTVSDYATGLTMLTDVQGGPDGNLYAVTLAEFTQAGPTPQSGEIVRILKGGSSETVLTGLSFPTSIDFGANGDAYVTVNGMGEPGSGQVVMFKGIAAGLNPGQ